MILSFWTDRSGQTVQTRIRLLFRVYTICNSGCIFWVHYSSVKPSCSNFRVITAIFWGVRIFRFLQYWPVITGIPWPFWKNESNIHQDRKCDKGIMGFAVNNMLLQGFCYIKLKDWQSIRRNKTWKVWPTLWHLIRNDRLNPYSCYPLSQPPREACNMFMNVRGLKD